MKSSPGESLIDHPIDDALLTQGRHINEGYMRWKRGYGGLIDTNSLQMLEEKRDIFYFLSFLVHNTKPVGHQVASMNFNLVRDFDL